MIYGPTGPYNHLLCTTREKIMNKSELVATAIYKEIFENYLASEIKALDELTPPAIHSDRAALYDIYQSSSPETKEGIDNYLKSITSDITSIILASLGGVTYLKGTDENKFCITYEGEEIHEDLQEYFLMNYQESYN